MNRRTVLKNFAWLAAAAAAFPLARAQMGGGLRRDHPDGYLSIQTGWKDLGGQPDYHKIYQQYGGDLRNALSASRDGIKRGVMVVFSWDNCPFTQAMRDLVFNNEEIQSYARSRMVMVNVNVMSQRPMTTLNGIETTEKRFAENNQVTATPTFFYYDTLGVLRYRHHGAVVDRQFFHDFLRLMADGVWNETVVEDTIQARHGRVRRT